MIVVDNVNQNFGNIVALQEVNLSLAERRLGIIGANGSGKTTFARMLNGLQIPKVGNVIVDGLDTRVHARDIRKKVGFVFQDPDSQIIMPTVEEDIAFGLKNLGYKKEDIIEMVDNILSIHELSHLKNFQCSDLSGGEKQLIALAGVLIMEPEYIVFDEPTTFLDLRNRNKIVKSIESLKQKAIVITHDLDLIKDFERVIVFDNGKVVEDSIPEVSIKKYISMMQ